MGWIAAILFALLTGLALRASGRCSRLALEIIAAALGAGYGWQGSPDLAGHPVHPSQSPAVAN